MTADTTAAADHARKIGTVLQHVGLVGMLIAGVIAVTCPLPGVTHGRFFQRADMMGWAGQDRRRSRRNERRGSFGAWMQDKLDEGAASLTPHGALATRHR